MPKVNRRTVLRLGAGVVGAAALGATVTPSATSPRPPSSPDRSCRPHGGVSPPILPIARPPGQTGPLRPDHRPARQRQRRRDGDGRRCGAGVWHRRSMRGCHRSPSSPSTAAEATGIAAPAARTAGAMVLDELLPMLGEQGLDTSRVGFLGWSMGGYGALLLGARLGPARTAAICAVSPALWMSSGASAPGAFDGPDDFAANSVFGLPALASIPIRIDCGDADPFARPPDNSSRSCRVRRPAGFARAGTTARSGVRSCPARSAGWLRC